MGAATGYAVIMMYRAARERELQQQQEEAEQAEALATPEEPQPVALTPREERAEFLTAAQARPTTKEAFALWYSVYLEQHDVAPDLVEGIDYPDPLDEDINASNMQFWTPTAHTPIPALPYDAPLRLLVITPHIYKKQPQPPRTRIPERQDWGSNTLLFLDITFSDGEPELRASTNKQRPIQTYQSVEAHRQGKSIPELLQAMYDAEPR